MWVFCSVMGLWAHSLTSDATWKQNLRRIHRHLFSEWLLKAVEVATLLQTTNVTISRWETGANPVDAAAFTVLALIVLGEVGDKRSPLDFLRRRRLEIGPPIELGTVAV